MQELFQNIDLNLSNTSLTDKQSSYPVTTATNKDYTSTNREKLAVESYCHQISSFTKPNLTSETGFTGLDISNKRLQSNGTNSPPKTPQYSESIKPHPLITPTVPCYVTPVSTPLSCMQRTNKRKFPGPAGCLPNLVRVCKIVYVQYVYMQLCMYYIYVYICMYMCMYICMYIYIYICIICMYVYRYVVMYVYMYYW